MTVVFKGGTSGNREDASPQVPTSGAPQPVLDTTTRVPVPSTVHFQATNFDTKVNREQATPDFMPTGGETSKMKGDGTMIHYPSTDVSQPDIRNLDHLADPALGEGTIFRGSPNLGTSLAPKGRSEDGAGY